MKFEKKYAKVMKEKEEIALDQLRFLFSAIDFIVSMGKLAEFQKWQADKAMDAAICNNDFFWNYKVSAS
jgi:hypothetical protein